MRNTQTITQEGDGDTTAVPTFSILVPSYNSIEYFETALESALRQMGPDDELVIQDGGSVDGTRELLEKRARDDQRVRFVVEADAGQSDALNRALERAQGEWVIWLNADDIIIDGALDAVREAIRASPDVDVVTGNHQLLRADGTPVDIYNGRPIATDTLLRSSTCASFSGSVVIRTMVLHELGGFNRNLHCTMDYELQFRLAAAGLRQVAVSAPLGALRIHDASKTSNLWRQFASEAARLRMANAHSARQRMLGVVGTLEQLASFAVFRLRMTPLYRKVRHAIV